MSDDTTNDPQEPEVIHVCAFCELETPQEELTAIRTHRTWRSWYNGNAEIVAICESCSDDSFTCNDCGSGYHSDQMCSVDGDHIVCEHCIGNYSFCDEHEIYYGESCRYCDEDDYSGRLVHDYSYRPTLVFFSKKKDGSVAEDWVENSGSAYTGFELEMEATHCGVREGAELANDLFSKWTCLKHDGSLNNGFEMVSQPMTREYFMESFPWQKVKELSDFGMRSASTRTCGLHVHINKSIFRKNPTILYRFMSMFYSNARQWQAIAGRTNSSYATWTDEEASKMLEYARGLRRIPSFGDDACNYGRYVALNLQNRHTLELRFFKGTLNPTTLAARIEAVHAVADYAVATRNRVGIKSIQEWDRFREWTVANNYNTFNTYAEKKGV